MARYNALRLMSFVSVFMATMSLVRLSILPKANEYLISPYSSLPLDFWIMAGGSVLTAAMVFLMLSSTERWSFPGKTALLGAVYGTLVLYTVPLFQGYSALGRGDVLTHYGIVREIMSQGMIPRDVFYPADHLIVSSVSICGSISVGQLTILIPAHFAMFYIICIFILTRAVFKRRSVWMLATAFSVFLPFGVGQVLILAPSVQCFLMLPFVIFLLVRSRQNRCALNYSILVITLLFTTLFFHPLETLLLLAIIVIRKIAYSRKKARRIESDEHAQGTSWTGSSYYTSVGVAPIVIIAVSFYQWYFTFSSTEVFFLQFVDSIMGTETSTQMGLYTGYVAVADPSIWFLSRMVMLVFGPLLMLFLLGFLFFLTRRPIHASSSGTSPVDIRLSRFVFYGFWFFLVLTVAGFFGGFLVGSRYSKDFVFFAVLAVSIGFSDFLSGTGRRRKIAFALVACILVLLSCLTVVQVYRSPITIDPGDQITQNELSGAEWLFSHMNRDYTVASLGFDATRFGDALLISTGWRPLSVEIPPHFGYDENESMNQSYSSTTYVVITKLGRDWYPVGRAGLEEIWLWSPEDFSKLESDVNVVRIFDNGGFNIYCTG